jgi:hypothetical protein
MEFIPIEVECHAGYKAGEYPTAFTWLDKRYEITDIMDRWYQADRDPAVPPANYFKVRASDRGRYILRHAAREDTWTLVV